MELFSEIYGSYYNTVANVLRQAAGGDGLTRGELERIVREHAFSESGLHLIPRLLSGEWQLLCEREGRYHSRLAHADTSLPMTKLQKAWVKSLLADRRIRLFLADKVLEKLVGQYREVAPLFLQEDFLVFDAAGDGDNYTDEVYIRNFRIALRALREGRMLLVEYLRPRDIPRELHVLPLRMLYSAKDDKFRLECLEHTGQRWRRMLLNMARVQSVVPGSPELPPERGLAPDEKRYTVTFSIANERNALERCMLQFAAYDKQTVWNERCGRYICEIIYDPIEETELLIRLLSFGPVIEVLGPERFVRQVRKRIRMQIERME